MGVYETDGKFHSSVVQLSGSLSEVSSRVGPGMASSEYGPRPLLYSLMDILQAIVHNELGGMGERTVGEGLFMEKAHLRVYILPPQSFMGWHLRNSRGWQLPPGSPECVILVCQFAALS